MCYTITYMSHNLHWYDLLFISAFCYAGLRCNFVSYYNSWHHKYTVYYDSKIKKMYIPINRSCKLFGHTYGKIKCFEQNHAQDLCKGCYFLGQSYDCAKYACKRTERIDKNNVFFVRIK